MKKKATYEELKIRVLDLENQLSALTDGDQQVDDENLVYRIMLESISDTVVVTDDDGRLIYVCPNANEIFGLSQRQVFDLGSIKSLMQGSICSVKDLQMKGELKNIEWKITDSSGRARNLLINAKEVKINEGTILYVMRDVTDRIRAEQAIKDGEKKYRLAMEATSDGVWDWNIPTGSVYYSAGWNKILSEKSVEPRYSSWESRLHPEDKEKTIDLLNAHLDGQTPNWAHEHRLKTGNEEYKWVLGRGQVVERDPRGLPMRMVGTMIDISERKEIENSLLESEKKWKNILLNIPQIGIALDSDANIIFVNDCFLSLTGWEKEEILHKNWFDLFIPDAVDERVRAVFNTTMRQKDVRDFAKYENEIQTKSGEIRYISWSNVLTKNTFGEVVDVTCMGIDLSERRRTEEKLQNNIEQLESLSKIDKIIRHGTDAEKVMGEVLDTVLEVYGCDRAWLVYPCDPEAEYWTVPYERTRREFPGASVKNEKHPMTADVAQDMRELLESDDLLYGHYSKVNPEYDPQNEFTIKSYLVTAVFPKGHRAWEFGIHQCSYERSWTDRELTLFKEIKLRIEDALSILLILSELKRSEEKFRTLFEQAGGYCMILDPDTSDGVPVIIDANKAACAAHGYTREEFVGRPVADIGDEKGKLLVKKHTAEIMTGEPFYIENIHVRKDGSTFPVAVNAKRIDMSDGRSLILTTEYDITERKRMESELIQSQKMESIGSLAGGVAHEFNNILAIILGNNELLMDDLPFNSLAKESAEEIRIAGLRAREVVKQLLTFSRQDDASQTVMDFRFEVEESIKLIRSSTPANIKIEVSLAENSYPVLGNATQINQLLFNICNNAIDALPEEGGKIKIELTNENLAEDSSFYPTNLQPGRYVRLAISDNGAGMEQEVLSRIFEPFFTTKEVGMGTGIGMAVVHGIVKRHAGVIMADSRLGQGATFTMYFPVHEEDLAEQRLKTNNLQPTGNEKILLVDDEPAIVKLGERLLSSLGYQVETTQEPGKAIEMVKNDPRKFDLLISDMAMPSMTGKNMIIEILKIRSDIKTILCTGYSATVSEKEALELGVSAFLMKPLNKSELAKVVRKVLDE